MKDDNNRNGLITDEGSGDGIDRRGFLKCMAWAGAGTLVVLDGGIAKSFALADAMQKPHHEMKGDLSFVQISDTHIGFN